MPAKENALEGKCPLLQRLEVLNGTSACTSKPLDHSKSTKIVAIRGTRTGMHWLASTNPQGHPDLSCVVAATLERLALAQHPTTGTRLLVPMTAAGPALGKVSQTSAAQHGF